MKAVVVQHVLFEDLGVFAEPLRERGYEAAFFQAGVELPSAKAFLDAALCIVLGGPIGANDEGLYPFIADELRLVGERIKASRPLLGICLGAQYMAKALGARVYPNKGKEICWSALDLTPEGMGSPLKSLEGQPVLHWHGDTFDLPEGAELLASTAVTKNQAFSLGPRILALQFHPEADSARQEQWLIGHSSELGSAGVDIPALRADGLKHGPPLKPKGIRMLEDWLGRL
jgi:GMP synthase (glutamine-hydrolysing)